MTEEAIREFVLQDECLEDVEDTGRMFDGYKIYWGVPQDRFCNGGSYGEPIFFLVKGVFVVFYLLISLARNSVARRAILRRASLICNGLSSGEIL